MGGHGGLNILPQKRWNVYNYENREKVRRDEEAAAKEEQLKREQSRKRDTEFRLEQLRVARGLAPLKKADDESEPAESEQKPDGHINLFDGIKIFDPIKALENEEFGDGSEKNKKKKQKMMKKEEVQKKVVTAEDEKYRLGYGVAGKGTKLPWYLEKRPSDDDDIVDAQSNGSLLTGVVQENMKKKSGKKTLEELREERLKREKKEKERERALLVEKQHRRSWK
ncbi:uncharacterized protein LOC132803732 [Ziziphus jujuba]|uniref:Uncharacterized protein LOC132803732 n=1 Tax=Ziziphus jujuba TaxID=326968 RepID=A0A6P4AC31_ZIZJJ|nr:uncharacterized protein LOC132803732 [Ziziphus jujuba]XP_060673169.1 uncharacterized protein LOC132803732 [Ziziphus jujuba]